MSAFSELARAPLHEFLELEKYPGSTFYKFPYKDCPGFSEPERPWVDWVLGRVKTTHEEDSSILKCVLQPCKLEPRHLGYRGYVVHARAFIVPHRILTVACMQPGSLVVITRPTKTPSKEKPGLKLFKPNGDGVTLRL